MKTKLLFAFAVIVACARTADAALQFEGHSLQGKERRFILNDPQAGRTSDWLAMGQTFRGHTIVDFDPKGETLSVRNAEGVIRLPLKPSKIAAGKENAEKKPLVIAIAADGRMTFDGAVVEAAQLEQRLAVLARQTPDLDVVLQFASEGDFETKKSSAERIPRLMKAVGFKKFTVTLQTLRPGEKPVR
jgi:biopolymer transport protein ExbD